MDEPIRTAFVVAKNRKGQIALIQEGGQQARGLWCLPGGHVDEGESLEEGAVREAREEAGLDVVITGKIRTVTMAGSSYLGDIADNANTIELHIFKADLVHPDIHCGAEELDARWCGKEDIAGLNMRWPFLKDLLMEVVGPKIKAVVFDMGGVIKLDPGGNILESIARLIGAPVQEFKQEYWRHNHLSNVENMEWEDMVMEVVRVFSRDRETEEKVRETVRANEAAKTINTDLLALFPVLRAQGMKVAIFSNATIALREELKERGITPLVDEIVISGEIGYQKPHREAFDVLFQRLGLSAEEVVFVDDSPKSLEKSGEIGYTPILFKDNEQLKRDLEAVGIAI